MRLFYFVIVALLVLAELPDARAGEDIHPGSTVPAPAPMTASRPVAQAPAATPGNAIAPSNTPSAGTMTTAVQSSADYSVWVGKWKQEIADNELGRIPEGVLMSRVIGNVVEFAQDHPEFSQGYRLAFSPFLRATITDKGVVWEEYLMWNGKTMDWRRIDGEVSSDYRTVTYKMPLLLEKGGIASIRTYVLTRQ